MDHQTSTNQPVIQVGNRYVPNPTGKGGFQDHPELRNNKGRPRKGYAVSDAIRDLIDENPEARKTLATTLLNLALGTKEVKDETGKIIKPAVEPNLAALREIMDRLEGRPTQPNTQEEKVEVEHAFTGDKADAIRRIAQSILDSYASAGGGRGNVAGDIPSPEPKPVDTQNNIADDMVAAKTGSFGET